MSLRKLALFDLDHTLIPMDSDHAWGEFTMARGWVNPEAFKRQNDVFYAQYKNGTLDIEAYVRFSTAAFCQQGAEKSMAVQRAPIHVELPCQFGAGEFVGILQKLQQSQYAVGGGGYGGSLKVPLPVSTH